MRPSFQTGQSHLSPAKSVNISKLEVGLRCIPTTNTVILVSGIDDSNTDQWDYIPGDTGSSISTTRPGVLKAVCLGSRACRLAS